MLGKDGRPSLVVRKYAPTRRNIVIAAIALLAMFGLYVVYELGRYNAGYDRLAVAQKRTELEVEIERLEKANHQLRTQLAELDTIRVGRAREQAEVARAMGDLQAQVARQSQELAFYRGVVAQGAAAAIGVKVGQARVSAGTEPGHFVVHLSLVRSGRADAAVTGAVAVSVEGESGGAPATLDLASLTAGKQRELPYNFRYFENFDQDVTLPTGFKPEHLAVEVHSSRKDVAPLAQTFLWSVETAP
jgi:hypothetical protein